MNILSRPQTAQGSPPEPSTCQILENSTQYECLDTDTKCWNNRSTLSRDDGQIAEGTTHLSATHLRLPAADQMNDHIDLVYRLRLSGPFPTEEPSDVVRTRR